MALQVWLPLTKDLRNQGLSDVTVTNNGATFNSAGKLGGCYSFGTGDSYITVDSTPLKTFTEFSFACWVKIISWNTSYSTVFAAKNSTSCSWNNLIFSLLRNSSNSTLCFNISNGSSSTTTNCQTGTLSLNTWYHITCTYKSGEIKLYQDGNIVSTYNTSIVPNFNSIVNLWIGKSNASSYQSNNLMNDVRIYDHRLSPMEVKELSKGLVLHYPLNRQGFGQDNLMPNSVEMPVGSANPSTGTWRLAGDSRMTRSRVAIPDAPSGASTYGFQSVGLQTGQDASCWGIDSFPRESGATYTLSAWGRIVGGSTTAAMLGFSVYNGTTLDYGGTYGQAKSSDVEYYGSGAYDYAGGKLNPNGNWTRIYRTFTSTATSGNIYIGFNTAKTGSNVTLQLCGVKLEKGDKMTPWIPNSNESMYTVLGLNGTTEYDCSGFCNNGIKNNLPTYSSDTAKYAISTHVDGVNQTIQLPNLSILIPDSIFTFNIWFKRLASEPGSKAWETILGGPSGFEIETCSANNVHDNKIRAYSWGSGMFEFELDKWNMLTMVSNGANALFYLNGELKLTGTYKALVSGNYFLGSWRDTATQNYRGYICDARIYATALSASDVKSLYQNCATIDPDGTIRGKIRS